MLLLLLLLLWFVVGDVVVGAVVVCIAPVVDVVYCLCCCVSCCLKCLCCCCAISIYIVSVTLCFLHCYRSHTFILMGEEKQLIHTRTIRICYYTFVNTDNGSSYDAVRTYHSINLYHYTRRHS